MVAVGVDGPGGERDDLGRAVKRSPGSWPGSPSVRSRRSRSDVAHAFHSPLMDPILDEFEALAASVPMQPLQIALATNLSGRLLAPGRHPRRAVLARPGAQCRAVRGRDPRSIRVRRPDLRGAGPEPGADRHGPARVVGWGDSRRGDVAQGRRGRVADPARRRGDGLRRGPRHRLGGLGIELHRAQRVALPTYPFDRSRRWIDLEGSGNGPGMATVDRGHPLTRVVAGSPHPTVQSSWRPIRRGSSPIIRSRARSSCPARCSSS